MSRFMWGMAARLAAGLLGLAMAFYSLERLSLINLATSLGEDDGVAPLSVTVSLFVGLSLVFLASFFALAHWSEYLREHPKTPQMPPWALILILLFGGGLMLWALATHSGWLRAQQVVPLSVNWGYVSFQIVAASLVLVPLVLLAARWSPGYKPVGVEAAQQAP